jgi:hypothetical protein
MTHEDVSSKYSADELIDAIRPVSSIISKCEKAQQKFIEGTSYHKRFQNIINAMNISKSLITEEISRRV